MSSNGNDLDPDPDGAGEPASADTTSTEPAPIPPLPASTPTWAPPGATAGVPPVPPAVTPLAPTWAAAPPPPGYPAQPWGAPPPPPGYPAQPWPPAQPWGAPPPPSGYPIGTWGAPAQAAAAPTAPPASPQDPARAGTARGTRTFVTVVIAVAVVVFGAGVGLAWLTQGSGTGSNGASATSLLQASNAAAGRSGSFRYVSVSTSNGRPGTIRGDAGPDSGRQDITEGGGSFTLVLVGGVVYFKGDATSVESQLGLSPSVATQEAGTWISVQSGDSTYGTIEAGITTQSALAQISLSPTSVTGGAGGTQVIAGSPADPSVSGTASLTIAGGSKLPVSYSERTSDSTGSGTFRFSFSNWGEAVNESAPTGAAAYASLPGANGPAGSGGPTTTVPGGGIGA